MSLSDAKVRNAKPKPKPYKIADGEGLFMVVMPNGSKYWRMKYFFAGKEKLLAVGVYPDISLAKARERRAQAREAIAAGNDPGEVKKEAKRVAVFKNANVFEVVAREWYEKRRHEWADSSANAMLKRLEKHILPRLGQRPVADITAPEVLSVLRVVENSGALDTAHRVMQICGQIFMYAIATGRAQRTFKSWNAMMVNCKQNSPFASCCSPLFALPSYARRNGRRLIGTKGSGGFRLSA
jgi:hypothetical protein